MSVGSPLVYGHLLQQPGLRAPLESFSGLGPADGLGGSPATEAVRDTGRSPMDVELEAFHRKRAMMGLLPARRCERGPGGARTQERPKDFRLAFPRAGSETAGNIRVLNLTPVLNPPPLGNVKNVGYEFCYPFKSREPVLARVQRVDASDLASQLVSVEAISAAAAR